MSHAYHEKLPGFHADQILHDGCDECEIRSAHTDHGISSLDVHSFTRALARAREWNARGLASISDAELPMLHVLAAVDIQLARLNTGAFS